MAPELESWDRVCGSLNLKCLLSGSQGKMSAILVLEKGDKDKEACEVGWWWKGGEQWNQRRREVAREAEPCGEYKGELRKTEPTY